MAKTLQFRRGNTGTLANETGAEGEIFIDTTKTTVVVMDGSTPGGKALATEEFVLANSGGSAGGDAVFDSALIGDVSIVSNTISGLDSYGNLDTLVVEGNLDVSVGSSTTDVIIGSFGLSNPQYSTFFSSNNDPGADLVKFVTGAIVTVVDESFGQGTFVFQLTGDMIYDTNESIWRAPFSSFISGTMQGAGAPASSVTVTSGSITIPLSVTAAGVNVNGTFTVNGAPVSGGGGTTSYTSAGGDYIEGGVIITQIGGDKLIIQQSSWTTSTSTILALPSSTVIDVVYFGTDNYTLTLTSGFVFNVGNDNYEATYTSLTPTPANPLDGYVTTISYSGSASYDQDLNTTDDVVFASALIGDVSIVSNTISGLDSYGNTDTLIVDGDLQVDGVLTLPATPIESIQTTQISITPVAIEGFSSGIVISTSNGFSLEDVQKIASITPGTIINMSNIFVPSQGWSYATGSMEVSQIVDITSDSCRIITNSFVLDGLGNLQGGYYGTGITSSQWTWDRAVTVYTPSNALVADASGVAITGTLTVNGVPVSSSYDQDLNTTDDIVFNSALIGDVSIIGNTIGAVDSYGLADTLVVGGNLSVVVDNITPLSVTSTGVNVEGVFTVNGSSIEPVSPITTNQDGSKSITVDTTATVSTLLDLSGYGQTRWTYNNGKSYFVIPADFTSQAATYFTAGTVVSGFVDAAGKANPLSFTLATGMTLQMISATTGWAAETVEPEPNMSSTGVWSYEITATQATGSTADYSFDAQGAFTAPSLVADSALIGDISIISNTISAVDSYGNAEDLNISATSVVFDQDLTLSINSLVENTYTVDSGMNDYFSIINFSGEKLRFSSGDPIWADSDKFVTGSVITASGMSGLVVLELTAPMTFGPAGAGDAWTAGFTLISGSTMGYSVGSVTVQNTLGATEDYSFNDQGIFTAPTISTTELLINGSPAGILTISQDGTSKSLEVDSIIPTTEVIITNMDSFTISSMAPGAGFKNRAMSSGGEYWADASKFVIGSVVTLVDTMTSTTYVIELTSNMVWTGMAYGWIATYTDIGSIYLNGEVSRNTVSVTNQTGSVATYSFDDQGTVTATSLLADSALIGDLSIVGNTISAVDSYGNAEGLNISATSVVFDQDLTLSVDSTSSTTSVISGGGMAFFGVRSPSQGNVFTFSEMSNWTGASSFVTGNRVSITDSMGMGNIVVQLTSGMTYNGGAMRWQATYTVVSGGDNILMSNYSSSTATVTVTTGSVATYSFDDQGTVTATSLLSDSALIGDLSIVGNTISGLDSYGNADTLVVDNGLTVSKSITNSATESVSAPGGQSFYMFTSFFAMPTNDDSWADASKFVTGCVVTLEASGQTYVVQLTSGMTYNGDFRRWQATYTVVSGDVSSEPSATTISLTTQTTTIVNPLVVTDTGVAISGNLTLDDNAVAPTDAVTVVKWAKISVAGQVYYTPLYQ